MATASQASVLWYRVRLLELTADYLCATHTPKVIDFLRMKLSTERLKTTNMAYNLNSEALQLARSIHRTMRQRGYGIGEIGYYIKEDIEAMELTDDEADAYREKVIGLLETMEQTGLN